MNENRRAQHAAERGGKFPTRATDAARTRADRHEDPPQCGRGPLDDNPDLDGAIY